MLTEKQLYDKINACWIGKNIGGTLGGPTEGTKEKLNLTDLPELGENGALANDDLDLQLVNLHALEQHGTFITARELSEEWREHVYFPYDEYGYASTNLRKGFVNPLSGYYINSFTDCMGSPIRSELWAAIAPGKPQLAAYFAYHDSMVDHTGGEGLYGEMFYAALESLAFVSNDINNIVGEAIKYIPEGSVTSRVIKDTFRWYNEGVTYDEIREKILSECGNANFTDAPQNIAFTAVGLLYGKNFKDCLLKAVNLGYDTDCTAATLGAVLGILNGTAGIPEDWIKAVGQKIKVSYEIQGFNAPETIAELSERTLRMKKMIDLENPERYVIDVPEDLNSQIFTVPLDNRADDSLKFTVAGENGPLVIPEISKKIKLSVTNNTLGLWDFELNAHDLKGNSFFKERISLDKGESKDFSFEIKAADIENMTSSCNFTVTRFYNNSFWTEYSFRARFPLASKWDVNGETQWGEDGHIVIKGKGKHTVKTTVDVPDGRYTKIVCMAAEAIKVTVDGEVTINSSKATDYIPAYHRRITERLSFIDLKTGRHEIEIDIDVCGEQTDIMLMFTAPNAETHYFSYYFADFEIGK